MSIRRRFHRQVTAEQDAAADLLKSAAELSVGKQMNRTKLIIIFLAGFVLGIVATMRILAIKDVEVRALPYENQGVVLQEQLVVQQNGINLILPKGMELNVLYRGGQGSSVYYIPLTFGPYQEPKTTDLATRAKFFKDPTTKRNRESQE